MISAHLYQTAALHIFLCPSTGAGSLKRRNHNSSLASSISVLTSRLADLPASRFPGCLSHASFSLVISIVSASWCSSSTFYPPWLSSTSGHYIPHASICFQRLRQFARRNQQAVAFVTISGVPVPASPLRICLARLQPSACWLLSPASEHTPDLLIRSNNFCFSSRFLSQKLYHLTNILSATIWYRIPIFR